MMRLRVRTSVAAVCVDQNLDWVIRPCVIVLATSVIELGLRGSWREWVMLVCGHVVQLEDLIVFVIEPSYGRGRSASGCASVSGPGSHPIGL